MTELPGKICITGMGMVTALGLDVNTSCAAARAGVSRAQELDYFSVPSLEDGSVSDVIGHAVPEITRGFEGNARLLRLMQAGLADLQKQVPSAPWKSARTAFYLSLPHPRRILTGLALIQDKEERQRKMEEVEGVEQKPLDNSMPQHLLAKAARLCGWHGEPILKFVATTGNVGVAEAISKAASELLRGDVDIAIVGGVDSLLDEKTLEWLEQTGRLKTQDIPAGMQPGEAAAFHVLERLGSLKKRSASFSGIVERIELGHDNRSLFSGQAPDGQMLARVLDDMRAAWHYHRDRPAWIITDQNGGLYAATEWGHSIVRLCNHSTAFQHHLLWFPCASFGDTGAASGAVAICLAFRAFIGGYAPASNALLVSSSDDGTRGAVLLGSCQPD